MIEKLCASERYGPGWRLRLETMPDRQVYAIYMDFLNKGKLDPPKKSSKKIYQYERQINIYDILSQQKPTV